MGSTDQDKLPTVLKLSGLDVQIGVRLHFWGFYCEHGAL